MEKVSQFDELDAYLAAEVNLRKLVDKLAFDPDDLERANMLQPQLYLKASKYKVQLMRLRGKAQRKFEMLCASKRQQLRRLNGGKGRGERMTESGISDAIIKDGKVRRAKRVLDRAFELEEFGKLLVDAFRQRRDVVRNLVEMRNSEMANEIRSVRNAMARNDVEKMRTKARRRLRELEGGDD